MNKLYIYSHCKFCSLCRRKKIFPNITYLELEYVCVCFFRSFHSSLHKLCIFEMHTYTDSLDFHWHAVFLVIFRTFCTLHMLSGAHTIVFSGCFECINEKFKACLTFLQFCALPFCHSPPLLMSSSLFYVALSFSLSASSPFYHFTVQLFTTSLATSANCY